MSMFETAGGSSNKKRKWIMIGIGTALIAIFLVIRNSMRAAQANAAASTTPDQQATNPVITDTGSYPSDSFGGGISGTGMDQTLATYLAIADQNTSVQMGAVTDALNSIHDQMNTNNQALQDQITAINSKVTASNLNTAPQPPVTSTPSTTSHPTPAAAPTYVSHLIKKGETLSQLAVAQYGSKQAAYSGGGIKAIQAANPTIIKDPNKIYAGQTIKIPTKIS
jgi:nucleoid-associated protein YgaU